MTDHEWPDPDFGNDGDFGDDLGSGDTADLSADPSYGETPFDDAAYDASFDAPHDASHDASFGDASYGDASYGDEAAFAGDDAFEDDFDDDTDTPGDSGGDPPVGADPDLDPVADHDGQPTFPPALDLDPTPEPVDGFPWADPTTLGDAPLTDPVAAHTADPDPTDLASYAAQDLPRGADPWTALAASEDPATSTLARFWSNPT